MISLYRRSEDSCFCIPFRFEELRPRFVRTWRNSDTKSRPSVSPSSVSRFPHAQHSLWSRTTSPIAKNASAVSNVSPLENRLSRTTPSSSLTLASGVPRARLTPARRHCALDGECFIARYASVDLGLAIAHADRRIRIAERANEIKSRGETSEGGEFIAHFGNNNPFT